MQTYLVGGAVRDQLLGRHVKERDYVVVGATIKEMKHLGYTQVGKDFPVFLHPQSKEEYALARTERKQGQGYTGFICDFNPDITLEQDLERRDLTVNAIAQDEQGQLIDPFGGQDDIEKRLLRHVSPAFSEDPLRVLRVARFRARYHYLGFNVAEETLTLMRNIAHSGELQALTPERVWMEWQKALDDGYIHVFIDTLAQCDALSALSPALATCWPTEKQRLEARIDYGRTHHCAPPCQFAQVMQPLDDTARQAFYEHYRVPKQYIELAEALANHGTLLGQANWQAKELITLFNRLDIWRRPQRLDDLVQAYGCAQLGDFGGQSQLLEAAAAAQLVNAQTYIRQGIQGAAIKTALAQGRVEAIENILAP
ncbi:MULTISPECIES: tRNA nucleotidyltransferase [unclassified Pseudoalteromonas]|uniref:tRNA nucleotidyltransferase n=1 Tax=unclassified Pseudoalteromonas TaxID=194690 RepID=UPI000CF743F4|nr:MULTISPECIES: tRNA nucleotidyltransferase [unclassified Pseudoalteromonas]MBS3798417.1 tRNA nucleotidyltransferase [Pseudoalteromonas sp. BDTF-M6]